MGKYCLLTNKNIVGGMSVIHTRGFRGRCSWCVVLCGSDNAAICTINGGCQTTIISRVTLFQYVGQSLNVTCNALWIFCILCVTFYGHLHSYIVSWNALRLCDMSLTYTGTFLGKISMGQLAHTNKMLWVNSTMSGSVFFSRIYLDIIRKSRK